MKLWLILPIFTGELSDGAGFLFQELFLASQSLFDETSDLTTSLLVIGNFTIQTFQMELVDLL